MTPEDLLVPRFKVIADFWDSPFKVGQIIEMTGKSKRFPIFGENNVENWETWIDIEGGGAHCYSITKFEGYPILFKKLEWWEDRTSEQMPEYVSAFGKVYKVKDADEKYDHGFVIDHPLTEEHVFYSRCVPATEQEYNDYIKSKQ